jgi:hypothetical protein
MADETEEQLRARIAELETELANRPEPFRIAGPTSPNAGPRLPCAACNNHHGPGQCSICATCHRYKGSEWIAEFETEPCPACGSKGIHSRLAPSAWAAARRRS